MERRNFIKNASIGSAALVSAFSIPAFSQERKLKIGLIGAGWYGMVIATAALKNGGVEVIAVCDVDSDHLNSSADELAKLQGTRPKTYKHYQELLDINGFGSRIYWNASPLACTSVYCSLRKRAGYLLRKTTCIRHKGRFGNGECRSKGR